jgi:BCCT, betaine/carnitine/choline family transporter
MTETRQPEEQSTQPSTRINPIVFFGSAVCIIAIALWAIISPKGAGATIGVVVGWISEWFGWFYILIVRRRNQYRPDVFLGRRAGDPVSRPARWRG